MKRFIYALACACCAFTPIGLLHAQQSRITEEIRSIKTYPFDDPNPVPFLTEENKKKIYPYHGFDGYSVEGVDRDWKVVKLENDYIEVYVLPEAGGKVWGAIEKSTGKEFLYKNEVMKFRNVAQRGPWTSGGIEFNFGYIGHTPSTATPVDYITRQNPDGSVSCIVGAMDLPSRTHWRVEIRLPADKAWFETNATWYNPTPLVQSYYNWMTGAARVSDDLQFFYPGSMEYEHNGTAFPWPVDSLGRDLSWYANNDFGSHKSFHIAGTYNDFMGGYYHDSDFGFGHWSLHDEMPGKKLWLWALSRNGGIWEDLLTDDDGQYMEFQAGRGYNQYSPSRIKTPITQLGFSPGTTDQWRELWFPVKETGGLSAVSPSGILHAAEADGKVRISINALAVTESPVVLRVGTDTLFSETIRLQPMEVYTTTVNVPAGRKWAVSATAMNLRYGPAEADTLKRPTASASPVRSLTTASQYYQEGVESKEFRDYEQAKHYFAKSIELDPYHLDALTELAAMQYRNGRYDSALDYANRVLREDTYHPSANFQAGIAYVAKKDWINALDCFGWASRSVQYRSDAFARMAAIYLQQHQPELALHYADNAIAYNNHHVFALQARALALRQLGRAADAAANLMQLYDADPLNHFARYEEYRNGNATYESFSSVIQNEFAWQTHLETALTYLSLGAKEEAMDIIARAPEHPLIALWGAYLAQDATRLQAVTSAPPDFVFPYRLETLEALEWAANQHPHWKFNYYLALNYQAIGRAEDAEQRLKACGNEPDYAPFYLTRAALLHAGPEMTEKDILRAYHFAPDDRRVRTWMIDYYHRVGNNVEALAIADRAWHDFPDDYSIGLWHARQLLLAGKPKESSAILDQIHVLPYEGASQGRVVYEQALLMQAVTLIKAGSYKPAMELLEKSREWPEHLGVGKPYDSDGRFQDYLTAYCLTKLGRTKEAGALNQQVISYTLDNSRRSTFANLLGLMALQQAGRQQQLNTLLEQLAHNPAAENQWVLEAFKGSGTPASDRSATFGDNPYYSIICGILELRP